MQFFIETRHGKINYFLSEPSVPKALVLCFGGSGEYRTVGTSSARQNSKWLNSHNFSCIQTDKYGCGESEGEWKKISLDIIRDVAIDISSYCLNNFKIPVFYLGQSEGSKVGFEVATTVTKIKGFALRVPSHQDIKSRIKYQLVEMSNDVDAFCSWDSEITEAEANQFLDPKKIINGFPLSYWKSAINRPQPASLLSDIQSPIFVLNGDADPYTPEFAFKEIHSVIERYQHMRAKVYKGVGHALTPPDQKWDQTVAAGDIVSWFDSLL